MLDIPTRGFALSVAKHNVELDVLCDWIEASVLFLGEELSVTDFVDTLHSGNIYRDQNLANDLVLTGWAELRRRALWLGPAAPFKLSGLKVKPNNSWEDMPAYSFCLALSLRKWYKKWAKQFGKDFTTQGELFEELTKEALECMMPEWKVEQTGWTRKHTNGLPAVVRTVATCLGEPEGSIERWTKPTAKEAGLDLVCYRPFPDGRVGLPVYLIQCASGGDWDGKLHTPNLKIWSRIVNFAAMPKKAFSTPFAFLDSEYIRNCNLVDGLLLDRCRLLSGFHIKRDWLSKALASKLIKWIKPRIKKLPALN